MKGIICNGLNLAAVAWLAVLSVGAQSTRDNSPTANPSAPIPMDQLGAVAGKQYHGDGLSVSATPDGARLRCAFQRLEGEVTRDGLWLRSTAGDAQAERFRVIAVAVERTEDYGVRRQSTAPTPLFLGEWMQVAAPDSESGVALCFPPQSKTLPVGGVVSVNSQTVRFSRPGLTEEYSVSVDGVRQDFIVEQRPPGEGELRVELAVTGAKAEPLANGARPVRYPARGTATEQREMLSHGARLVLDGSGRKLAYNRLRVVDATGRELPARMEVAAGVSPAVEGAHPAARISGADFSTTFFQNAADSAGLEAPTLRQAGTPATTMLAVVVDDASAIYPVRIDPTFSDADWISMSPSIPGANNKVRAAVVDGSGNLYIGGDFTAVGDVIANYIAKWNGSSWLALGSGMNGGVYALALSGSDLYAGGGFTTAGGSAANCIARWNGNSWSALGWGMGGDFPTVYALAVSGSNVYAGGSFTTAGGSGAWYIAKWDGSSWSTLDSGMGGFPINYNIPFVSALVVSGSDLYAGGHFTSAGGHTANYIAKWDGSSWSALGSGVNDIVWALAVSGSNVYAGGWFTNAGGSNYVAKWDGSSWTNLGSGMSSAVRALAVSASVIYAGGGFVTAGGSAVNCIAEWNGSNWTALGSGLAGTSPEVYALAMSGSNVYAGGYFATAGGAAAHCIAKLEGSGWTALGSGMNRPVYALAVLGSDVFVGGAFTNVSGTTANYIARWNGSGWTNLGSGMNGGVGALAVSGSDVFAGGTFTRAGGSAATNIAKWDGGNWSALGSGMNGSVGALAASGSDVYAGGWFTTAGGSSANRIAKWDGNSWTALGSGMNRSVYALAVSGSNVYAGGVFTAAGGSAATNIAKWNGSSWTNLGSGMNRDVLGLAVSGSNVYAGGLFTTAGGSPARYVAKWNGSSWSALGSGMNDYVYALAASGSNAYAGGWFKTAGGSAANRIAKWNGSNWSALGSGMNDRVFVLAVSGSDLYAGGEFTTAGGKVSAYTAKAYIGPARGTFSNLVYSSATGFSCTFLDGSVGQPYRIQTSPSLAIGPWTDLTNFIYASPIVITDASAVTATNTFYRAVTP